MMLVTAKQKRPRSCYMGVTLPSPPPPPPPPELDVCM